MGSTWWKRTCILPLMLVGAALGAEDTASVRIRNSTDHAWSLVPLGASGPGFVLTVEVHGANGTVATSEVAFGDGKPSPVRLPSGAWLELRPRTPFVGESASASFATSIPEGEAEREDMTLQYELQRTPEGTVLGQLRGSFGSTGTSSGKHFTFVSAQDPEDAQGAAHPEEAWHRQVYRAFTFECAIL